MISDEFVCLKGWGWLNKTKIVTARISKVNLDAEQVWQCALLIEGNIALYGYGKRNSPSLKDYDFAESKILRINI